MLDLLFFSASGGVSSCSSMDWEENWRNKRAILVLEGITAEEHFRKRTNYFIQLLNGLIKHFSRTDWVSNTTLGTVEEIIDQIDTDFLGIHAWQQAQSLPDRVRNLASMDATKEVQTCLSGLKIRMRVLKTLLPKVESLDVDNMTKLSVTQDETLKLFEQLSEQVSKLREALVD